MQPNPVLVRIGPLTVYWYGVLIVSGAMLAAYVASRLSRDNGHDPEIAWNALLPLLATGIVGARLYHIASSWDYYRVHPEYMFGLQMTGFAIYGAVLGGAFGLWLFTRISKLRFLEWADYVAPGLLLAQAVGRWGNYFNQELYGYPTNLPWGIYIAPEHRLPGLEAFERFHPTFLYESLLTLPSFVVLYMVARRWTRGRLYGDLILLYGIIYPVIRFFIEFQRPDAWRIGGVPTAQWVSLAAVVFCTSMLFIRRKLRRPNMVYVPGKPWSGEASRAGEPTRHGEHADATAEAEKDG